MLNLKKIVTKLQTWMIPLKISLFLIYGANGAMIPFLEVYVKQKGLDVKEIALLYLISSGLQVLALIGSGIFIDKVGHPKFILLGTLIFQTLMLNGILFVPNMIIQQNCKEDTPRTAYVCCYREPNISSNLSMVNSTEFQKSNFSCYRNENIINNICNLNKSVNCSQGIIVTEVREINTSWNNCAKNVLIVFNISNNELEDYKKNKIIARQELHCGNSFCICRDNNLCLPKFSNCADKIPCNTSSQRNKLYFRLLLICFLGYQTTVTTVIHTMDIIIMSLVKAHNLDFGREIFWATIGTLLFSGLSGNLVENLTKTGQTPYYESAVYLSSACAVLAAITICAINMNLEKSKTQSFKQSISLLMNIDIIIFLIIVLMLGTCANFQKHFTSLYLDFLGASSLLLSLRFVGSFLPSLPFLAFSNFFIRNGKEKFYPVLAFIGYVAYFVGYAYLKNPWWCLILEATGIITHHLLWVAVIRYSSILAPKGLSATVIAISGALHFCIGSGTSSLLGGLAMSKYGGRVAYKVMAITAGVSGLLYAFYLCIIFLYAKLCKRNREAYSYYERNSFN